jgi:hypothetical protein
MTLSLLQFRDRAGARGVAAIRDGAAPHVVTGTTTILGLAREALAEGRSLELLIRGRLAPKPLDLSAVTLLSPIEHADPAHLMLSGTGLTHLGSAEQRDRMHRAMSADATAMTDSMKMFQMGLAGGKPAGGGAGVQPEWFYKGDGDSLVACGAPLPSPEFALDAGEEPELAGVYFIADDGSPVRIGFALGNEFSDHVTERHNYLWLAHSKLRPAAIGHEVLVSALPRHIAGTSRIVRDGQELWSRPFLTGEDNMSHSIANLEHHHFKYHAFCRPGDIHVHFFGTGTLSFGDGIVTRAGDEFEISAPPFALRLRNPLTVRPLRVPGVRTL